MFYYFGSFYHITIFSLKCRIFVLKICGPILNTSYTLHDRFNIHRQVKHCMHYINTFYCLQICRMLSLTNCTLKFKLTVLISFIFPLSLFIPFFFLLLSFPGSFHSFFPICLYLFLWTVCPCFLSHFVFCEDRVLLYWEDVYE